MNFLFLPSCSLNQRKMLPSASVTVLAPILLVNTVQQLPILCANNIIQGIFVRKKDAEQSNMHVTSVSRSTNCLWHDNVVNNTTNQDIILLSDITHCSITLCDNILCNFASVNHILQTNIVFLVI